LLSIPSLTPADIAQPSLVVPVNIDTARPQGSTGMVDAILALAYDPKAFQITAADVQLGTVPQGGSGWHLVTEVNAQTGLIGIELYSANPIQTTAGGSLVTITLHPLAASPSSLTTNHYSPTTALTFLPYTDPNGGLRVFQTQVSDASGAFVIHESTERAPSTTVVAQSLTSRDSTDASHAESTPTNATLAPQVVATLPLAIVDQVLGELGQTAAAWLLPAANIQQPTAFVALPLEDDLTWLWHDAAKDLLAQIADTTSVAPSSPETELDFGDEHGL
jgi:hypothetical protein